MRKLIVCTLAVFAWIFAFGQNRTDSVKVYFHVSQYRFDPNLDGNAASMNSFIESVRAAAESRNLDKVVVRAYASPEGTDKFNNRLAEQRCATITSLILKATGISPDIIESIPEGVSWAELRRIVAEKPGVPSRVKILNIIDNTPLWIFDSNGSIVSGRKKRLMDLRGGRPWNWLIKNIFPELRNSVAVSYYLKPESSENTAVEEPVRYIGVVDSSDVETVAQSENDEPLEIAAAYDTIVDTAVELPAASTFDPTPPYYCIALKTNMLYYGVLLPNLELEWLVNDRWSIAVEGNIAWWGSYKKNKSYRLALIDAELRRWIKPREPWHGMYVGLIAGGGWYDLANGGTGHLGSGAMTGLSFGYMWPITRRLSFDAELGVGYVYTRYKDYKPFEGHHIYQRTKDINYFGPIKLKFSIAWRLFDISKSKKSNPLQ